MLPQDAGTAFTLSVRYPGAQRVFVAHSDYFAMQIPPQLDGVVRRSSSSTIAYVGRSRARRSTRRSCGCASRSIPGASSSGAECPASATARPALGNYLHGPAVERLAATCRGAGLELVLAGTHSTPTSTPERTIADADVVFGLSRCVLEAMACGRAAYVYGISGGDEWVTPDSYPALEANGFAGMAHQT